ncbi:MAG TPA: glycosyltransferase family 39 protein [Chloroflexota bacterium]|nr:glycosyltransferase family 39 protein [Chloroflexota bacterium]
MSELGDALRGGLEAAPGSAGSPVAPPAEAAPATAAEQRTARAATIREIADWVAPGTPAEAIGLALALLVAVVGQQLLGQRPLVVPVLGACALALLGVRLLARPPRRAPLRRPPAPPAPEADSPDTTLVQEAATRGPSTLWPESFATAHTTLVQEAAARGPGAPGSPAPVAAEASGPPGGVVAAASARDAAPAVEVPGTGAGAPARARDVALVLGASRREWLLRAALLLGAVAWVQMRGRPGSADYTPVVLVWLASMAVAGAAAAWPLPTPRRWAAALAALPRADWLVLGGVTVGALLLRAVWINHVPYVFAGDEGAQALAAVDVLHGQLRNPFGTGPAGAPTLFTFLEAGVMRLAGETVAGARLGSAALGALAVLVTYLLGRRLFGRTVAITAAVLLAVYHYHVLYSRVGTAAIADALLLVAALYFLDRTVVERRPLDALAAGLVVGLGAYASALAGRVLPVLAIAYLLYAALWDAERLRPRLPRRAEWRALAPQAGWLALGAALVALPLLAHYADFPAEHAARADQLSIFQSGWLAQAEQTTGRGAVGLVLEHVWRAALLLLTATPGGWYGGITPTLGALPAILPAIGLALVTLGAWRRRYFGLAVAYWAAAVALGLIDDPAVPSRAVIVTALLALITALGLCAPLRFAAWLGDLPRPVTGAAIAAVLVAIGLWNFQTIFRNPDPAAYYGTENGLVATELAYYVRALGPGTTVYLFGAPRIFYQSFPGVAFIAPGASGSDVERPLAPDAAPLPLRGTTVFAFLPERLAELPQVRAWYPGGVAQELRSPRDAPLLTLYRVDGP